MTGYQAYLESVDEYQTQRSLGLTPNIYSIVCSKCLDNDVSLGDMPQVLASLQCYVDEIERSK